MAVATLTTMDALFKDLFPRAGDCIKQWVVDERRERAWAVATCPRVSVATHEDNTGAICRNSGGAPWVDLDHDCCHTCGDLQEATAGRSDIAAWLIEQSRRPPICADRAVLSNEIAPDESLKPHPILDKLRSRS